MKDNFVRLVGNIGAKPELKDLGDNKKVCSFSVATSKSYRDQAGNWQRTDPVWHRVTLWDGRAETAAANLDRGDRVEVLGEIYYREWADKDGVKHVTAEIRGDAILNIVKPVKETEDIQY